jgi:hypothetical protein
VRRTGRSYINEQLLEIAAKWRQMADYEEKHQQ